MAAHFRKPAPFHRDAVVSVTLVVSILTTLIDVLPEAARNGELHADWKTLLFIAGAFVSRRFTWSAETHTDEVEAARIEGYAKAVLETER